MSDGKKRDRELLSKIQDTLYPDKAGHPLDYKTLAKELRILAKICEAERKVGVLENSNNVDNGIVRSRKKLCRSFNLSEYRTRFIALQVLYFGWDYLGFASQDCDPTIEKELIKALKRTKLIPEEYEDSKAIKYSKCGRTDKGVSAFGQVVSLIVRSKRKLKESEATLEEEYDYPTILNAVLPPEIRVWGWTPVDPDFSARYSPISRIYKYYIIDEEMAPMDMTLVQQCTQKFLGLHNFRNFCKMNLSQTSNHEREIEQISLEPITNFSFPRCHLYCLTVKGNAFLWHQVRCIVSILFMVGRGLESPEIIDRLLDVNDITSKPLYAPANEIPLVLWGCEYSPDLKFIRSHWQLKRNRSQMRDEINEKITQLVVQHHIYDEMLSTPHDGPESLQRELKHVPLLERQREPSFAERMERHLEKIEDN